VRPTTSTRGRRWKGISPLPRSGCARAVTGLDVPTLKSAVADAPDDFESRLERVLPHLSRLTVLVPEKHDLVLMKAMRCYEHDLEAIVQIHANSPLDPDTLIRRFKEEMAPIGNPTRIGAMSWSWWSASSLIWSTVWPRGSADTVYDDACAQYVCAGLADRGEAESVIYSSIFNTQHWFESYPLRPIWRAAGQGRDRRAERGNALSCDAAATV
jgi:hypothetical protein